MDNKTFIDSLKVGDEVAVMVSNYSAPVYRIQKVESIAARAGKRTVVVEGCKYDEDGYEKRERSRGDVWSHRRTIGPIADKVKSSIKRRREQNTIANFSDWGTLSDDKIARIAAILEE